MGRFGRMVYEHLSPHVDLAVYDRDSDQTRDLPFRASFEEAAAAPWVVLCVPISELRETCVRLGPHLGTDAVVADTCSVKVHPLRWMLESLPASVQILGTHPLFGPDSGARGIRGLKIALVPARIEPRNYRLARIVLRRLGLKIIEVTPQEHDRRMAQTQAVFHWIAEAMRELGWHEQEISTPGPAAFFQLLTTVQNDTAQLFRDLERENPFASSARKEWMRQLEALHRRLEAGRDET